jgi:hypothetical protein
MILKLMFVFHLRFGVTLAGNVSTFGYFTYRGNVSYSDLSLLISEIAPRNAGISPRYCAVRCLSNLDCNAVETCSAATGSICRLSSTLVTVLTPGKNESCSRYEMVRFIPNIQRRNLQTTSINRSNYFIEIHVHIHTFTINTILQIFYFMRFD